MGRESARSVEAASHVGGRAETARFSDTQRSRVAEARESLIRDRDRAASDQARWASRCPSTAAVSEGPGRQLMQSDGNELTPRTR